MIDLHRLRRYNHQDGDGTPNDDLAELIGDIHWAADQIERLTAELDLERDEIEKLRALAFEAENILSDFDGDEPGHADIIEWRRVYRLLVPLPMKLKHKALEGEGK